MIRESIGAFLVGKRPVAIHAGFRGVASEFESPEDFVEFILRSRNGNTTMFPTFSGKAVDSASNPPSFDVRTTECYTGLIPTAAWSKLGSDCRTLHPTHSWVILGPNESLNRTDWITPCGSGTPIQELIDQSGIILLVGTGLQSLTLIHGAEEAANVNYVLQPEKVECSVTNTKGEQRVVPTIIHSWETKRNYPRLEPELTEKGSILKTDFGFVVNARSTFEYLKSRLEVDPSIVLA